MSATPAPTSTPVPAPTATLRAWLDRAWGDHAGSPRELADALMAQAPSWPDDADGAEALRLAEHVLAAHLGDAAALQALLDTLPPHAALSGGRLRAQWVLSMVGAPATATTPMATTTPIAITATATTATTAAATSATATTAATTTAIATTTTTTTTAAAGTSPTTATTETGKPASTLPDATRWQALSDAQRWRALHSVVMLLVHRGDVAEARRHLLAEESAARESHENDAARAYAATANNTAADLREGPRGDPARDALMIEAAELSRRAWERAGTWMHVERADYQLARCHAALGQGAQALAHAAACLQRCESEGADAAERFFAHEALVYAHRAAGRPDEAATHRERMAALLAEIDDAGMKAWCAQTLAST